MIEPIHYHPGLTYEADGHRVTWTTAWVRVARKIRAHALPYGLWTGAYPVHTGIADRIGEKPIVVAAVLRRLIDDGCVTWAGGEIKWILGTVEDERDDRATRAPGCECQLEEGDSPCPVHGLEES